MLGAGVDVKAVGVLVADRVRTWPPGLPDASSTVTSCPRFINSYPQQRPPIPPPATITLFGFRACVRLARIADAPSAETRSRKARLPRFPMGVEFSRVRVFRVVRKGRTLIRPGADQCARTERLELVRSEISRLPDFGTEMHRFHDVRSDLADQHPVGRNALGKPRLPG